MHVLQNKSDLMTTIKISAYGFSTEVVMSCRGSGLSVLKLYQPVLQEHCWVSTQAFEVPASPLQKVQDSFRNNCTNNENNNKSVSLELSDSNYSNK